MRIIHHVCLFAAVLIMALTIGCGSITAVFDISNGDRYSYRTLPWENDEEQNAAARAKYYAWGAKTQYPTGTCHRLEIILYKDGKDVSQTNVMKLARYWIVGEKK